ncbi:MAG TPA: hypothetical protein DCF68_10480 [Cyanothece sp. UBA12306]|nr:hypothetical protein [Cyanothece sp. UBA12306]
MKTIFSIVVIFFSTIISPLIAIPTATGEIPDSLRPKSKPRKSKLFGVRATIYGSLDSFDSQLSNIFTVGGQQYETYDDTEFSTQRKNFQQGDCVKLEYHYETGYILDIKVVSQKNCSNSKQLFSLWDAKVEKIPKDLLGTWIINGEKFKTNKKTRFYNEPIDMFSCVDVKYVSQSKLIKKIKKESRRKCYWY